MHPALHLIPAFVCLLVALLAADLTRAEWRAGGHRCPTGRFNIALTGAASLTAFTGWWIAMLPALAWIRSAL